MSLCTFLLPPVASQSSALCIHYTWEGRFHIHIKLPLELLFSCIVQFMFEAFVDHNTVGLFPSSLALVYPSYPWSTDVFLPVGMSMWRVFNQFPRRSTVWIRSISSVNRNERKSVYFESECKLSTVFPICVELEINEGTSCTLRIPCRWRRTE